MSVRGNLKYFREPHFRISAILEAMEYIGRFNDRAHLLISDGIIIDARVMILEDLEILIQRIVNPHQLQAILVDGDNMPYFIAVQSEEIDTWQFEIIDSIHDIMRIKTYSLGCLIFFYSFGGPWTYEHIFTGQRMKGNSLEVMKRDEQRQPQGSLWKE